MAILLKIIIFYLFDIDVLRDKTHIVSKFFFIFNVIFAKFMLEFVKVFGDHYIVFITDRVKHISILRFKKVYYSICIFFSKLLKKKKIMHDFEGIKKKFFSRPGHPRGQQHLYTSNSFLSLKRFYIKPINNKI